MKKLLLVIIFFIPSIALAATPGTCNVNTTPVNFGSYDVFSNSSVDTVGQVTVQCTGVGTIYSVTVQLNKGINGSIPQRKLKQTNGSDRMDYNLYIDAGRSTIWGDGTSSSAEQTISVPGGRSTTLSIYGRIPPLQDLSMGDYTDTVTVNISF